MSNDKVDARSGKLGDVENGKEEYNRHYGIPKLDMHTHSNVNGVEKYVEYSTGGLKRGISSRQLAFISIGSAIGTGLFLGSGTALKHGGPLGLFLGYTIISTVCLGMLACLGELVTFLPITGGHLALAGRFIDPAMSAAVSWNYWINYSLVCCAELSAAATFIGFWNESINVAAWIAIFLVFVLVVNLMPSRYYGEFEFWFVSIKIVLIVGLILLSIIITAGGTPNGQTIGFRYWHNPGPFQQYLDISGSWGRFLGFFAVLLQAGFSLSATEMIGVAAAETRNPRKAMPIAMRTVWIRITLFYVLSTFMIGLLVSPNDPLLGTATNGNASPFVIAIKDAGIRTLPSIVNAAVLSSALSAGCGDIYIASRTMHSLALRNQAPAFLGRTTSWGCPIYAILSSWLIAQLTYLSVNSGSAVAFGFFTNLTSVATFLTWLCICATYIRFSHGIKAQGLDRKTLLPWTIPGTYYLAWWSSFMICVVIIFSGWTSVRQGHWDPTTFFSTYTPIAWCAIFYAAFRVLLRSKIVKTDEMDFVSGVEEIEQEARECALQDEINRPTTPWGKFLRWWNE